MRHGKIGRKFGREKKQRRALFVSLINNFIKNEKIETTEARAKELKPKVEKLVTRAKKDTLANRRHLSRYLKNTNITKLVKEIAPKYTSRPGGYTRVIKLATVRKGDASSRAIIEFV